jgi:hypothetical protein
MTTVVDIFDNLDVYNNLDVFDNLYECAICFYPIITDKYVTDCSHTFHHTCIHEWSMYSPNCPFCKLTINIPEFNHEITPDEETRIAEIINSGLISDLEYQEYQKNIKRERETMPNNITLVNASIVLINDYTTHNCDNDMQDTTRRDLLRMRALMFYETFNSLILVCYSEYLFQVSIITVALGTSIVHMKNIYNLCHLTFLLKIIFIISSVSVEPRYNHYGFYVSCFPWIVVTLIK